MIQVKKFTFNPFQENTYVLFNETRDCIIIDPGCYDDRERKELKSFISENDLNPLRLLNTHCHIDHVFGNKFINDIYGLLPEYNLLEIPVMDMAEKSATLYGLNYDPSPKAENFIGSSDTISLGEDILKVFFTPGHAPGHVVFYCEKDGFVIAADVLFRLSIGRTDLPGGDYETLIKSIRNEMFALPDNTKVYSGHGEDTNIGYEKKNNPFLN